LSSFEAMDVSPVDELTTDMTRELCSD
jgi:hypothetical protein